MDPNSTNPPSDNPQQPPQDAVQSDLSQTPPPLDVPQSDPGTAPMSEDLSVTDPSTSDTSAGEPDPSTAPTVEPEQPSANNAEEATADDYVENVGGSLLDLMDEVNEDDNLIQLVADEMKIDVTKAKSILTTLLDKLDKEQITMEELAFIMAVTVADEPPATQ